MKFISGKKQLRAIFLINTTDSIRPDFSDVYLPKYVNENENN